MTDFIYELKKLAEAERNNKAIGRYQGWALVSGSSLEWIRNDFMFATEILKKHDIQPPDNWLQRAALRAPLRTPSSRATTRSPTHSSADGAVPAAFVPAATTLMANTPPNRELERTVTRLDRMVRVPAAQFGRSAALR